MQYLLVTVVQEISRESITSHLGILSDNSRDRIDRVRLAVLLCNVDPFAANIRTSYVFEGWRHWLAPEVSI